MIGMGLLKSCMFSPELALAKHVASRFGQQRRGTVIDPLGGVDLRRDQMRMALIVLLMGSTVQAANTEFEVHQLLEDVISEVLLSPEAALIKQDDYKLLSIKFEDSHTIIQSQMTLKVDVPDHGEQEVECIKTLRLGSDTASTTITLAEDGHPELKEILIELELERNVDKTKIRINASVDFKPEFKPDWLPAFLRVQVHKEEKAIKVLFGEKVQESSTGPRGLIYTGMNRPYFHPRFSVDRADFQLFRRRQ